MHIDLLSSLRMCPAQVKSFRFFSIGHAESQSRPLSNRAEPARIVREEASFFICAVERDGRLPHHLRRADSPVLLTVTSRTRVVVKFFCQEWTGVGMEGYE